MLSTYVSPTHGLVRLTRKKITYCSGCNKSKIDFCIMGKVDQNFLENVKVITGRLQHNLVIVDIDKKQKTKT